MTPDMSFPFKMNKERRMSQKPDDEGLEERVKEPEKEALEKNKAREELRVSNELLEKVFSTAHFLVAYMDARFNFIRVNRAYAETSKRSPDFFIGKNHFDLHPNEENAAIFRRVVQTGESVSFYAKSFEYKGHPEKGVTYWNWDLHPLKDESGKVKRLILFLIDVTSHKRDEEALRQSNERLKEIASNIPGVVIQFMLKSDGTYASPFIGENVNSFLGISAEEVTRDVYSLLEFIVDEDLESVNRSIAESAKTLKIWAQEFKIRTRKGEIKWLRATSTPHLLPDGGVLWNGVFFDITDRFRADEALKNAQTGLEEKVNERTAELLKVNKELRAEILERKRTEDALKVSEEKYRDVINNANSIILRWDKEGKIIFMNPFGLDFFGYDNEELIGRNVVSSIVPETETSTSRDLKLLMKDVQKDPDNYKNNENENIRKDGGRVWVSWTNRAIVDGIGNVKEILSIGNDITEKKHLETRLQQALKMEAIGTLAGGVAHDLNNVLSGIVTYPELLLMQISEDSPLVKPLLTIQNTGKKAADIVQDLLTLARRGVIVSKVVNLNNIIREYFKSPEYEKLVSFHPNIKVETNLETDLLNVLGSPVHLSKTIMNLVSNAAEAMTHGGNLSLSTKTEFIDSVIKGYDDVEAGNYVVLSVSDTGEGMSTEDMQRIFEPFFTKKKMGRSGTGLGMAVVWGTVNDHKGYIDLQSTLGEGTSFKLYFPATKQQPVEDEPEITAEFYRGSGETILIIDDVKEQREIASSLLTELNYSVATVSSGENAIEYLKNKTVDLLLLDMIMAPGKDGLDTYKQILTLHPAQKALIASGFSETDRVREAQELGAGQYLKKPYTLEKLGIAVKNGLDQK
jgi:two-component system cell cycle sensor histidine kinase/response regulator CckA